MCDQLKKNYDPKISNRNLMGCMDGITGTDTRDGWKAKPAVAAVVVVVDGMREGSQPPAKYSCKSLLALVY